MCLQRYLVQLLAIVLCFHAFGHAQSTENVRLSITKDVMDEIAHNRIASVRERFSPELKDSLTENEMRDLRNELVGIAGTFKEQISQSTKTVQDTPTYVSKSQFEKFKV